MDGQVNKNSIEVIKGVKKLLNKNAYQRKYKITRKFLYEHYIQKKMDTRSIAKLIGCSQPTIRRRLKETKIKIRGLNHKLVSEARAKSIIVGYKGIIGQVWNKIKGSGKCRNLEFNITIEYIWDLFVKQNYRCALSGIKLTLPKNYWQGAKGKYTASLDRIDSDKGYIYENVQWIHKDINMMKRELKQDVFVKWCKKIANFDKKNNNRKNELQ